ncbi:MAG TPA: acyl-CoA dehydrogenase [Deltaproteobacteria bacterium]|jgi:alkylation response protein AidB-like acyl-CoA dehydrogenase|nr:acyl-CoA dehydrogenase [Deltaproteobacteria bacterium]
MDTRYTPEQAELRRTARRMARELGPRSVADLDDKKRARRLAEAVRGAGWLELRQDGGGSGPFASGVEAAIIADALGEAVADVPFAGTVLADDLVRRAGASARDGAVVAFSPDLVDAAVVSGPATTMRVLAVDCVAQEAATAYVLVPEGDGYRLAQVEVDVASDGADLTRTIRELPPGAPLLPVHGQSRLLTRADLDSWAALGLALTSADLVGLMRGVLDLTVAYAQERKQYGVPIGTFQAVQHLLAEARCLMEGAFSATLYPSWAVDNLGPDEARTAGRVAKAYSARAARTVCEIAVQVHGGMGNTWDCIVHVYLRRALLSSRWFGDDGEQLRQLQRTRLGVADGLS